MEEKKKDSLAPVMPLYILISLAVAGKSSGGVWV